MRALLAASALPALALAACDQPPQDPEPLDPAPLPAEPAPAASVMKPGLYGMGDAGQIYAKTRVNADGTYVDMDGEGTEVGGGTWEVRGELTCFDPEGDGENQQERCWTNEEPEEDGSFITTRDDGSRSYRVTPLDE
ncbi:hypothetical protein [Erythrobacter sp.]|uniref:hypothetical protein n=1 Tax=Erythrobacter sp. TaxID=1042 RepID=UPI0014260149|nr:hypothetical protein [Erythrobacter sp.]QIQ85979.1 MAG: hypothetical protein G9473_04240 [Erythrobacter sp.]